MACRDEKACLKAAALCSTFALVFAIVFSECRKKRLKSVINVESGRLLEHVLGSSFMDHYMRNIPYHKH